MSYLAMSPGPIIDLLSAVRGKCVDDFSDLEEDDLFQLTSKVHVTADLWPKFDARHSRAPNADTLDDRFRVSVEDGLGRPEMQRVL
jgi:hypothetical protein